MLDALERRSAAAGRNKIMHAQPRCTSIHPNSIRRPRGVRSSALVWSGAFLAGSRLFLFPAEVRLATAAGAGAFGAGLRALRSRALPTAASSCSTAALTTSGHGPRVAGLCGRYFATTGKPPAGSGSGVVTNSLNIAKIMSPDALPDALPGPGDEVRCAPASARRTTSKPNPGPPGAEAVPPPPLHQHERRHGPMIPTYGSDEIVAAVDRDPTEPHLNRITAHLDDYLPEMRPNYSTSTQEDQNLLHRGTRHQNDPAESAALHFLHHHLPQANGCENLGKATAGSGTGHESSRDEDWHGYSYSPPWSSPSARTTALVARSTDEQSSTPTTAKSHQEAKSLSPLSELSNIERLCRAHVPQWSHDPGLELEVTRINAGLTNKLFQVRVSGVNASSGAEGVGEWVLVHKVLFRVFGSGVDQFYCQEQEAKLFEALGRSGIAPKMYAKAKEWRIEQWHDGEPVPNQKLRNYSMLTQVASTLGRFHKLGDRVAHGVLRPSDLSPPAILRWLQDWTLSDVEVRDLLNKTSAAGASVLYFDSASALADEAAWLRDELTKRSQSDLTKHIALLHRTNFASVEDRLSPLLSGGGGHDRSGRPQSWASGGWAMSRGATAAHGHQAALMPSSLPCYNSHLPLTHAAAAVSSCSGAVDQRQRGRRLAYRTVLCHNDCQENNLLELPSGLRLIDFEYTDWNMAGYDAANFFNEWPIDYCTSSGAEAGFSVDWKHVPTDEMKRIFAKVYLSELLDGHDTGADRGEVPDALVEGFLGEVAWLQLASHLVWGFWSLRQERGVRTGSASASARPAGAQYDGRVGDGEEKKDFDFVAHAKFRFASYFDTKKKLLAAVDAK